MQGRIVLIVIPFKETGKHAYNSQSTAPLLSIHNECWLEVVVN